MDKKFITCLDYIIDLEQTSIIQDRTMQSLQDEIKKLGKSNHYEKPEKPNVDMPVVQYYKTDFDWWPDWFPFLGGAGVIIGGILGFINTWNDCGDFLTRILSAPFGAIIGAIQGGVAGFIAWVLLGLIAGLIGDAIDARKEKNAQAEAQRLYEKAMKTAESQYQNALIQYDKDLENDAKRVSGELKRQEILNSIYQQLSQKHNETLNVLAQFYDKADIYITYRNIIAMCHIAEYLKSGICTELTGPNGAFMVFKYEMYEKKKIEQLDTIIRQLDQLHSDNQILNRSLHKIDSRVSELTDAVNDVNCCKWKLRGKTNKR